MAKQIAKLLKASLQDTSDLKQIAKQLAGRGRGGDSMLVHITPKEAAMLKEAGGAGSINPDTGLMEFYETGFVPTDYGFETYTPAGSKFNVMEYAGAPNVKTGGYETIPQPELSYGFNSQPVYEYSDPTQRMAANQYAGSAFPYGANKANEFFASTNLPSGVDVSEFPIGMRSGPFPRQFSPQPVLTSPNAPPAPELPAAAPQEPSVLERLKKTATSPETLRALGVAGIQALPGILAARQAAAQGRQAKGEMQALAEPYRTRGREMVEKAQRGELTPVEQQQIQALQARAAQGAAARGGVGAEQVQAQIEAFRQQLLQNKYEMGLQVANIGDQIAVGAIRTGLSADQYVNELTNNYFTNIARSMAGQPQQVAQTPTQPRV